MQVLGAGSKSSSTNPRDNALYSHWYYKSDHHPSEVPSCGRLCSRGVNPDCEVADLKKKEGAEFICTGRRVQRTKINATDATSDFRIEVY